MVEKYTLITGGSMGIGKALAFECASRGMNLLLVALPGNELSETAAEIAEKHDVTIHILAIDLSEIEAPKQVYKWCIDNNYNVSILINNAGMAGTSVFETSELDYSDMRILVNIRALVLLTRLFIPMLKTHPKSYVLNIGSQAAYFAIPYKAVYSASKAFVLRFTQALQLELSETSISLCAVCPNGVETNSGTFSRIKAHGIMGRLTKIEASDLARISIDAMLNGKTVLVPKTINRILLVCSKLIPNILEKRMLKRWFYREVEVNGI
ncbi:MAG: SDR family NAD(P)-dependent oxidoreductase [Bacteroidales bacterium]|nr:SDR family NAD(P)-dependent oxidoreductase [Bacteroidales bacterium]MDZ4204525.1 SDR family NAD(P)-dependent oxidoreductase [Bacteroidales bacterium]